MGDGPRLDFLAPQFESREEALRNTHLFVGPLVPGNLLSQKELVRQEEPGFIGVLVSAAFKTGSKDGQGEVAMALQELWKGWFWVGGFEVSSQYLEYAIGHHVAFTAKDEPETGALLLAGRASPEVAGVTFEFADGVSSTALCRGERFVLAAARRRLLECAALGPEGQLLSRLRPDGWLARLPEPSRSPTWSFRVGTELDAEAEDEPD